MLILLLYGHLFIQGSVKPTCLKDHGHIVINPQLPDDKFDTAFSIAQAEYNKHQPDMIVGGSRGGAVAMNLEAGEHPSAALSSLEEVRRSQAVRKNLR